MADSAKTRREQASAEVPKPKFSKNYEFIVPSSYFGNEWAESKFGSDFTSFFLVGRVMKSQITRSGNVEYFVTFRFDRAKYVFLEEVVSEHPPVSSDFLKSERGEGVVQKVDRRLDGGSHGGQGPDLSFFQFFTS